MEVDEVRARLVADTSSFISGMSGASASVVAMGATSVAAGNLASAAIMKIGEVALNAATAIITWTNAAGAAAEQTQQLSMQLGISANVLEGWSVALGETGLNAHALAQGMRTLSKEMLGLQQGSEKSIENFQRLGFTWDQIDNAGNNTEQMIRTIADKFKEMPDGAEKSRMAMELFGRAGLQLIPILNQGAIGLDQARQKAIDFGLVLTDQERNALSKYDDALDDAKLALEGFKTQVAAAFAPALTSLVNAMTWAISMGTVAFNNFVQAGEKLIVRFAALSTVIELIATQIFSMDVFSKQAWATTLEQVKAVDAWAAAEIKKIESGKQLNETIKLGAEETAKYTVHQKALGEAIVSATQIELHQIELRKQHQVRMGEGIVAASKIEYSQRLEESRKFFAELMAQEEEASRIEMLGGPDHMLDTSKQEEQKGRSIVENYQTAQIVAQHWIDAYQLREDAALEAYDADMNAAAKAEAYMQEFYGKMVTEKAIAVEKSKSYDMIFTQSAQFAFGQIRNDFGNTMADMIMGLDNWQQFSQRVIKQMLNTSIQMFIEFGIKYAKQKAAEFALHQAIESGKTAGTAANATAREAITTTEAAAEVSIFAAAQAAIVGMFAAVSAAMTSIFASLMVGVTAVATFIMGVLSAIATALTATIWGIPYAGAILLGIAAIGAALALSGAVKLAKGGVVDKPTLAMIGEAGPEAVVPLDQYNRGGNSGTQTIIVELDNRVIARANIKGQMKEFRIKGVNA